MYRWDARSTTLTTATLPRRGNRAAGLAEGDALELP